MRVWILPDACIYRGCGLRFWASVFGCRFGHEESGALALEDGCCLGTLFFWYGIDATLRSSRGLRVEGGPLGLKALRLEACLAFSVGIYFHGAVLLRHARVWLTMTEDATAALVAHL